MPRGGPIYCETPDVITGGFPVELINTITNLPAIVYGILAFILVARYAPKAWELYLLAVLLVVVGVGSSLWHGLRESWALSFDVIPGILYFFLLTFLWATAIRSRWLGYAFVGLLVATQFIAFRYFFAVFHVTSPFVLLFGIVAAIGIFLVAYTFVRVGKVGWWGAGALISALLAATFRTIDMDTCSFIPFGTHFLWHIFLSTAAFCGFMLVYRLKTKQLKTLRANR